MNNHLTGCLLAFVFHISVSAQDKEPVIAAAYYTFIHVNDTTARDKHAEGPMVLYVGAHASYYSSNASALVNKQIKDQMDNPDFDGNLTIKGNAQLSRESFYFRSDPREYKEVYSLGEQMYLLEEEEYPEQGWQLTPDTMTIGGYACQKATTHFRGRDYIAWFTSELPFPYGPWKLHGLPGLILEARDSKKEVLFRYAGFDKITDPPLQIGMAGNFVKTNKAALENLKAAFLKDPQGVMAARSRNENTGPAPSFMSGMKVSSPDHSRIKSINIETSDVNTSPVENNPLELH